MINVPHVVEKIKHTFYMRSIHFFRKLCLLRDNVEKYGTARQATDDNIIMCMHVACWKSKATHTHTHTHTDTHTHTHTHTHSQYIYTYCFPTAAMTTKISLEYYVKRTLPALLFSESLPTGYVKVRVKGKISPITGLEWRRGFQEVKVPKFHDSGTGWW